MAWFGALITCLLPHSLQAIQVCPIQPLRSLQHAVSPERYGINTGFLSGKFGLRNASVHASFRAMLPGVLRWPCGTQTQLWDLETNNYLTEVQVKQIVQPKGINCGKGLSNFCDENCKCMKKNDERIRSFPPNTFSTENFTTGFLPAIPLWNGRGSDLSAVQANFFLVDPQDPLMTKQFEALQRGGITPGSMLEAGNEFFFNIYKATVPSPQEYVRQALPALQEAQRILPGLRLGLLLGSTGEMFFRQPIKGNERHSGWDQGVVSEVLAQGEQALNATGWVVHLYELDWTYASQNHSEPSGWRDFALAAPEVMVRLGAEQFRNRHNETLWLPLEAWMLEWAPTRHTIEPISSPAEQWFANLRYSWTRALVLAGFLISFEHQHDVVTRADYAPGIDDPGNKNWFGIVAPLNESAALVTAEGQVFSMMALLASQASTITPLLASPAAAGGPSGCAPAGSSVAGEPVSAAITGLQYDDVAVLLLNRGSAGQQVDLNSTDLCRGAARASASGGGLGALEAVVLQAPDVSNPEAPLGYHAVDVGTSGDPTGLPFTGPAGVTRASASCGGGAGGAGGVLVPAYSVVVVRRN